MSLMSLDHFVELKFLHQLKRLQTMVYLDAYHWMNSFSHWTVIWGRMLGLLNADHFVELKFLHQLK
jgi:hypothetical protein